MSVTEAGVGSHLVHGFWLTCFGLVGNLVSVCTSCCARNRNVSEYCWYIFPFRVFSTSSFPISFPRSVYTNIQLVTSVGVFHMDESYLPSRVSAFFFEGRI